MGMDSGIEIKVVNPKKGDNVVHPVGLGHATSAPPATQPSTLSRQPDGRRRHQQQQVQGQRRRQRQGHQEQGFIDYKPFKKWLPWLVPGSFWLISSFLL